MSLSPQTAGRLFVFAAAVLWSVNGFFVKNPIFADWPAERRGLLLAFWRAAFAVPALWPLVRRRTWRPGVVVMAVCFLAMNVVFLQSMVWTTAANAIWLQNIAPLWVCLFARLSGEALDRRDLPTLGFAAAGVGLILGCELGGSWPGDAPRGVLLGALSGLFYGGVVHLLRHLRDVDAAWLIVVNLATTAVCLAPLPAVTGVWPHGIQWFALAAFGLIQLGAPYYLFARGLKTISGQEGTGIGLLEPVLVPVWVYLSFGERPAWWTIVGGGLILVGLSWRYLPRRPAERS